MKKKNIQELIQEKVLIFDGAMGTCIQQLSLTAEDYAGYEGCNEYLVISRPDAIDKIHTDFLDAGSDIIETDTFGANRITLAEYRLENETYRLNRLAAELACRCADRHSSPDRPRYVSGSIGPGSKLPSLGHLSFDEIAAAYRPQITGLIEGGVDLLQIETVQDLIQAKAVLITALEIISQMKAKIPIIVQVTIQPNGKMLLGSGMETVATVFEPFPLLALGLNCATGPQAMRDHIQTLSQLSPFPITVLPNAGIPHSENQKTVYDLTPQEMARSLLHYVNHYGVRGVGGCCGTTPAYIQALADALTGIHPSRRPEHPPVIPAISSLYERQEISVQPKPLLIGERTNSNGSRHFRDHLLADDMDGMIQIALQQQQEQIHVLDVCTAHAERQEIQDMSRFLAKLNLQLSIPIMIDSTEPEVIESALKQLGGRAIINSINLEDGGTKARQILALVKKYGTAVVALTIDEEGMAKTAEHKLKIVDRLYKLAVTEFQLRPGDVFFDPLTFTLATGEAGLATAGIETLDALRRIKQSYPDSFTLLGVSNISYGLSAELRPILNSVFLYHAVQAGLDAAILHAGKIKPLHSIPGPEIELCRNLIFNHHDGESNPLHQLINYADRESASPQISVIHHSIPLEEQLVKLIIQGEKANLPLLLSRALEKYTAMEIINQYLLEGMKEVGIVFGKGEMQLPFVLRSAETMKQAVEMLQPHLAAHEAMKKARIVLATVKGDVHDIGKNLVDIILSNNGYDVINLGINQSVEDIMQAIRLHQPDWIGLSGLLVKSTFIMKENLEIFKENQIDIPVICGGAALTPRYVEKTMSGVYAGSVHYAKDAMAGLKIMETGKK